MINKTYLKTEEYRGLLSDMDQLLADPVAQFADWYQVAHKSTELEANAMTLATVDAELQPHVRIVLMKHFDQHGIIFFTNYHSQKARDIADNAQVSLLFWWKTLRRQVRINGCAQKISADQSAEYFVTRDRESQINAIVSPQSQVIASRAVLETQVEQFSLQHELAQLQCPTHWGGYRVSWEYVEFWQSRSHRLHDRIAYEKQAGQWHKQRLAP